MEDNRAEQIEALQVLEEFNGRLVKNMEIIVKELSGERLDDIAQFLKGIIDAINWEIQVVNSTMQVLNDGKRGDGGQTCSDQHLSSIGYDSLDKTRKCI